MTGLLFSTVFSMALVQAPAQDAPSQPPQVRLTGVWDLNKDLSTKPMAAPQDGDPQGRGGDRGGGGRPGGGGMAGGMMGRGGGMRGGGGRDGGRGNVEDVRKAADLMRELAQSPARLTITSKPDSLSVTDPEGVIRKFVLDGKTDKVAINGATVDVKSKWDGEVLRQEFKVGNAKFEREIETSTNGHQLVITVTPKDGGGGVAGPSFLRFVYDRSQLQ